MHQSHTQSDCMHVYRAGWICMFGTTIAKRTIMRSLIKLERGVPVRALERESVNTKDERGCASNQSIVHISVCLALSVSELGVSCVSISHKLPSLCVSIHIVSLNGRLCSCDMAILHACIKYPNALHIHEHNHHQHTGQTYTRTSAPCINIKHGCELLP